ncbi:MAG: response regulator transcription factor [Rheinheimera sp.]|nr:response regulator transcription factor [Rheinheimera sp.]
MPAQYPLQPLLLIEDDPSLCAQLQQMLQTDYQVVACQDGEQGLLLALSQPFALIILDIRLPGLNGLQLLQLLRRERQTPVIVVSACGAESDRITGFLNGADDYLAKPFNTAELRLRIEAVLRRSQWPQPESTDALNWQGLHWLPQQTLLAGQALPLTPVEHKLLGLLLQSVSQILSKRLLYPLLLNRPCTEHDRSLDMHVSRLRKKLSAAGFSAGQLQTVHGKGYRLC